MIWLWAAALGLAVTLIAGTATAALITVNRSALAEAIARRLRGGAESLEWLVEGEREIAASTATTGLGIALLAAAVSAAADIPTGDLPFWAILIFLILVALPVVLLSGYVLPRFLTARRATRVAELLRPVIKPWSRFLSLLLPEPAQRPTADIRSLWREGATGAVGNPEEWVLVSNVMAFAQSPIREIMTARTDLVAIPEGAGPDEIRAAFVQSGYSRLPVYRETVDEIVGMVHVFDLLKVSDGQAVPIRPVGAAPASRSAGDVLLDMQRERRHLTVVLDEFGGTLGIVTLEDLLEALVGEIFDEYDEGGAVRPTKNGVLAWETSGSADVAEIPIRFGVELPTGPSQTVGGRLIEMVGRFPSVGERFLIGGLEFDVLAASPTRIERIVVRKASPPIVVPVEPPR